MKVKLCFLFLSSLLMIGHAETYRTLDWSDLARGDAMLGLVRVSGRYLPLADYQELIRGVLTNGRYALRVEGAVFDWRPAAGAWVEVWGELKRDEMGYLLHVHNGRDFLDEGREPRPTPPLREGDRLQLWLNVSLGGSLPFARVTGVTEDGVVFTLPPDYHGPWRVVCLEGTLESLGNGWRLQNPKPCKASPE